MAPIFKVIIYDGRTHLPVRKSRNLRGIREYAAKHGVFMARSAPQKDHTAMVYITFGDGAYVATQFQSQKVAQEYCEHRLRKNGVTSIGLAYLPPKKLPRELMQKLAAKLSQGIDDALLKAIKGEPCDATSEAIPED